MLLALDIGNSNIVIGASAGNKWKHEWRVETDTNKTADEYAMLFKNLLEEVDLSYSRFDQIIICSVVPQLTEVIGNVFQKRLHINPLILDHTVETGIALKTDHPEKVGADLIAGAVGAYEEFGDNCIIVDFGTATTLIAVQNPGELIGGTICAGLRVTLDALVGKAAQLSQIPLEPPPEVIGTNTVEAMQSGLVLGHLCMVEGLIDRIRDQMGSAKVIATGGLSEKVGPYTNYFDIIDPMLTLDGLRLIAERDRGRSEK
ncbi:MAG TPA: type III pantothenate kinase [Balneolaceae bacterium]